MRLCWLYLRSRLAGWAIVGFVVISMAGWLWVTRHLHQPRSILLALVTVPLAAACVIGVGTHSPFAELEQTVSRSLALPRLLHLSSLLLGATLILAGVATAWPLNDAPVVVLRNLAGFVGLALIGARLLSGFLSWPLAVTFGMVAFVSPSVVRAGEEEPPRWAWPLWGGADTVSMIVAIALLVIGLSIVVPFGARQSPGVAD